MAVSTLYFLKAAEMGTVPAWFGNLLLWITVAGTGAAIYRFRRSGIWPVLLLWIPVPFYAYSIAYGSVPVFIPLWWPFSWYNTRYGMEMLPAFALFGAGMVTFFAKALPRAGRFVPGTLALLLVLNSVLLMHARPLVLQEAWANSRTRIPFERSLANILLTIPPDSTILMHTAKDVGAVQISGVPLRRIISEGDYLEWNHALEYPAGSTSWVIALDGDAVARAVKKHPENLQLMQIVCSTDQPCARIYFSLAH
jgi:hypothetical protein